MNGGQSYNTQCSLATHKSHPIDSIYVYNAVPLTGTTLPAVRVMNGGMLPTQTAPKASPLPRRSRCMCGATTTCQTATASSIGQNSTTYTWPAALMADAITILSGNWKDSHHQSNPTAYHHHR